jgi:hypothetical protein
MDIFFIKSDYQIGGNSITRFWVRPAESSGQRSGCTGTSVTLWTGDIRYKSLAGLGLNLSLFRLSPSVAFSLSISGFNVSALSGSASSFRSSPVEALLTALRSISPYLSMPEKTISSISSSRMRTSRSFFFVFYSAKRNSCLASVFFIKGDVTYGAILDIVQARMLWAKSYKGTSFTPAHIVEMDEEMDDAIKALEFAPATSGNSHLNNFLPLLLDRTMNTFPAIKNALTEAR